MALPADVPEPPLCAPVSVRAVERGVYGVSGKSRLACGWSQGVLVL